MFQKITIVFTIELHIIEAQIFHIYINISKPQKHILINIHRSHISYNKMLIFESSQNIDTRHDSPITANINQNK